MNIYFILVFGVLNINIQVNGNTEDKINIILTKQTNSGSDGSDDSNKHLSVSPSDSLRELFENDSKWRTLIIQNQNFPTLYSGFLRNADFITVIKILSSKLTNITEGAFNDIPDLKEIIIKENEPKIIPNGVFSGISIVTLDLRKNKISVIEDKAFNDVTLKFLYLAQNQIGAWKSEWFSGSVIESIFISNNLIEELPINSFNFQKKNNFHILDFSHNKIKYLHNGSFEEIGYLEELDLSNNDITTLKTGMLKGAISIVNLKLQDNKISSIEDGTFKDTHIQTLILDNNDLKSFPLDILKTKQVLYLFLNNCPLSCKYLDEIDNWKENEYKNSGRGVFEFPIYNLSNLRKNCT